MNHAPESGRRTDRRRRLVIGLVLAIVVALASEFHLRNQVSPPPLPKPNGFHYFAAAGRAVQMRPRGYKEMSADELRGLLQTNALTIELVREGLKHDSRISYTFDTNYLNTRMGELSPSRDAQATFNAAARLATLEDRHADAAMIGVLIVRFGHESVRGGVLIDKLVGLAIEQNGFDVLNMSLTNSLDLATCRLVTEDLSTVDARQESTGAVLANEKEWARTGLTLRLRVEGWLSPFRALGDAMTKDFPDRMQKMDRKRRELIIAFAARAYELERGQPPLRAAVLVPEYLKALPQDPETGTPMELPRIPK